MRTSLVSRLPLAAAQPANALGKWAEVSIGLWGKLGRGEDGAAGAIRSLANTFTYSTRTITDLPLRLTLVLALSLEVGLLLEGE